MELQHFSHSHPLLSNESEGSHGSTEKFQANNCCGCGEVVLGTRFSCMECGFHLHKDCAEAPSEVNHPFHRNHSLNLVAISPYAESIVVHCDFCNQICKNFVYHCSCNLDFHIKCALFSRNVAERNTGDQLQHVARTMPLTSTSETLPKELKEAKCFICWKPLLDSEFFSLDCGFCLHTKCVEQLSLENNHLSHRQHYLLLQFNSDRLPCQICQETQRRGLVYYCSPCRFVFDIDCISSQPVIENKSCHEHPFTRCFRHLPFICDACGTPGNYVSYICSTCGLMVHKKCISLPRTIVSGWHLHPLSHKYFVVGNEYEAQECMVCRKDLIQGCGSYYCSACKFIVHVNCALDEGSYQEYDESISAWLRSFESSMLLAASTFDVIKKIKLGENEINIEIKHFTHQHNLVLRDEGKDDRFCDGCNQLIIARGTFYCCLECNFFLHKSCADLPRYTQPLFFGFVYFELIASLLFKCMGCGSLCVGFAYECRFREDYRLCLRCAQISMVLTSPAHKHPIVLCNNCDGHCNGCSGRIDNAIAYTCKDCNFNVHGGCCFLPEITRHKFDEHCLALTYCEDNDYSEHHACDICEKGRTPSNWFYHCAICDTSAHPQCVLPHINLGYKIDLKENHPHLLSFVQKDYPRGPYPECCKCGKPSIDLALQCAVAETTGCNYNIHLTCVDKIENYNFSAPAFK